MNQKSVRKYRPFPPIYLPDRQWPSNRLTKPPMWCSVDLRDGNQALAVPMGVAKKLDMFNMLVRCGFKEIEVGFPSASQTEYDFVRELIEKNLIPGDVTIQVLVQAREDLIRQTCKSLKGAKRVIIHLYNSTSPAQRRVVFRTTKRGVIKLAEAGTRWVKQYAQALLPDTDVRFQYSPESFSATEVEFSLKVCEAVCDIWQPTRKRPIVLNLPNTVEGAMPNVYADQIEWFRRNLHHRDRVIISLHTHNDRGTGVAATELGLLAGADRVEGTLFGNGERSGNVDIIAVAMNMYAQRIWPGLDFSDIAGIIEVYERCTGMNVPPRHPYAGELVFTAFSGSHQDAIRKGLQARKKKKTTRTHWDVPYLTIDPTDIGRKYCELVRVNSQSGKGGVAELLERKGMTLPEGLLAEFSAMVKCHTATDSCEVTPEQLERMFLEAYEYSHKDNRFPYQFSEFTSTTSQSQTTCTVDFNVTHHGTVHSTTELTGTGNGPIDALVNALNSYLRARLQFEVLQQAEHSLEGGAGAEAIAYVEISDRDHIAWGVGKDTNIERANVKAIFSALNRINAMIGDAEANDSNGEAQGTPCLIGNI